MNPIVAACVISLLCASDAATDASPQAPTASLRSMRAGEGFQIELMACEPLVADPIAIAWGPDGRLWVVEMGDYPAPANDPGSRSRVRFLEDSNGDGKYDRSVVFLDDLRFVTSVMPWRGGVLITCAPDILFAEDTDGDGRADHREVLYSGFSLGNPQHCVNGLRYGLDNWIYCANGDNGGEVKSTSADERFDIRGRDLRIHPETGRLDPQTGMSQFSRCRDDWGNWFGGNNSNPLWHDVLADQYLRRNPYVAAPRARMSLMTPPNHAQVYPISRALRRYNEPHTAGKFTSACGAGFNRDELCGTILQHCYFVCEPAHNLVRCERMMRRGVTFSSKPLLGPNNTEFLSSTDNWFRPVQVRTGPDGALWVVDMYRQLIEHPEYIPNHLHDQLNVDAGRGAGRIYRIYPSNQKPRKIPNLNRLDVAGLVAALESPNGPQRDMAQQLLVRRRDESAKPLLEKLVRSGHRATARLHALCTLEGLQAADADVLLQALSDIHPAVRRHAVRISESKLNVARLRARLLELLDDPDPSVILQLSCSLGLWDDPRAGRALAHIAARRAEDPFIVAAVISSATNQAKDLLAGVLEQGKPDPAPATLIKDLLQLTLSLEDESACAMGLRGIARQGGWHLDWQFDIVASLLDGLEAEANSLEGLRTDAGEELRKAIDALRGIFAAARRCAVDRQAPPPLRARASRILGRGLDEQRSDVKILASLLGVENPDQVQASAAATLARIAPEDLPDLLLKDWRQHAPRLRLQVLDILVSRPAWNVYLLEQVESGRISPATLALRHRGPLLLHDSAEVRRRAGRVFDSAIDENRRLVVQRYERGLDSSGDAQRGQKIFLKTCSTCHPQSAAAIQIGPDLSSLTDRSPRSLLVAILDPNRAVDPRYVSYRAVTKRGRIFDGILVSETGNAITLVDQQGKRHQLLRHHLEDVASTGKSLMPEGLETEIPEPRDMLDLIAYLSGSLRVKDAPASRETRAGEEGGAANKSDGL